MSDQESDIKKIEENPTSAEVTEGRATISDNERESRREALEELVAVMSEAVREDGGELVLTHADYDDGIVEIELQGACGSCAISSLTLQGGVERMLRERLPWVTEVRGDVDESIDFDTSFAMGRGAYIPRA
ncbi:MAG: NifU family protein [Acidimicrobiales bacterium]